jgi:hypothetical protein
MWSEGTMWVSEEVFSSIEEESMTREEEDEELDR